MKIEVLVVPQQLPSDPRTHAREGIRAGHPVSAMSTSSLAARTFDAV